MTARYLPAASSLPDPLDTTVAVEEDFGAPLLVFAEVEAPYPAPINDATKSRVLPTIVTVQEVAECSTC